MVGFDGISVTEKATLRSSIYVEHLGTSVGTLRSLRGSREFKSTKNFLTQTIYPEHVKIKTKKVDLHIPA